MLRFLLFGGRAGRGSKQPKKKKKKHAPAPSPISPRQNLIFSKIHPPVQTAVFGPGARCCFLPFGRVPFLFCCLGGERDFLLFGRVHVFFFAVWAGGGVFFFAVWAAACLFFGCLCGGACLFLCCLGRERVFVSAVWAGTGVHSLTGLPGTSVRIPTRKKTNSQTKTRVPM